MKGTTTGNVDVYLDGVKKTTDQPGRFRATYKVNLWSTGTIADGAHMLKLVRSTSSASGKFISPRRGRHLGDDHSADRPLRPDQQQDRLHRHLDPVHQDRRLQRQLRKVLARAAPRPPSTSPAPGMDWIGMKGTTTGYVDVYLDGVKQTTDQPGRRDGDLPGEPVVEPAPSLTQPTS